VFIKSVAWFVFLWAASGSLLCAQTRYSIDANSDYYYRLLQVSGLSEDKLSFTVRPMHPESALVRSNPWGSFVRYSSQPLLKSRFASLALFEPKVTSSFNSTLPRGLNDGAVWQGRGLNSSVEWGALVRFNWLHVGVKPVLGFAQNAHFNLGTYPETNRSPFNYRVRPQIDLVQRFGDTSYTFSDWGDSFIDLRYRGWRVGLSNERIWSGPSTTFPLLFSYQGPGFVHAHVSSYRPLDTPAGTIEFKYVYGGLQRSEYFNNRLGNRLTSIHALIAAYSPRFVRGLSIGGQRLFMETFPTQVSDFERHLQKMFNPFVREGLEPGANGSTWDPDNQMATVFMRWVHPKDGFELYAEYGRNDHNLNARDFRMQPDHLRAYSFGVIKTARISDSGLLGVNIELVQTESTRSSYTRGLGSLPTSPTQLGLLGSWYTHMAQTVGFTNRGQMIGSGFGPGGNAQLVQADYFYPAGKLGVSVTRIVYHNTLVDNVSIGKNFYEIIRSANPADAQRWQLRNVEYVLGFDHTRMMGYGVEVSGVVEVSRILNHQYITGNDLWNVRVELVLRKRMAGWLR
jgi:hypothetical protein